MISRGQKFRWTTGYFFLFIGLGLNLGITGPVLSSLAAQTHVSLESIGLAFLVGSLGSALGTNISGRFFDRLPGHPILGIAQLLVSSLLFAIPFVPWFWLLLVIFFIKGFFEGTINNGNNSLLVWTHKDRSGPFMNALHFCFGVGALLSPWLYSWYVDVPGSYRWAYCFIAGFAFLAALYMLLIPNSPDPVQGDGDKAESNLKIGVNYPLAVVAALYLFFYVGAEIAFGNWIFTYARTLDLANPVQATLLTSAFWASFTVGRLISIPVAVKVQPRRIILASLFACLVVLGLVMVLPTSEYTVWIMSIALGFFMAPVWPMGFTLVGKVTRLTARTSGIVLLGDSIGGMMLPWLMGVAIVRLGAPMLVYLVFASLMFNLLAFWGVLTLGSAQKQSQSVPA